MLGRSLRRYTMTKVKYCVEHGGIGPFEYDGHTYYVAPVSTLF